MDTVSPFLGLKHFLLLFWKAFYMVLSKQFICVRSIFPPIILITVSHKWQRKVSDEHQLHHLRDSLWSLMTSFRENSKKWVGQLEIMSAAEFFLFSHKCLFMLWEWISGGKLNAIYWQSTLFACNNNDWVTDSKFSFASVPGHYT